MKPLNQILLFYLFCISGVITAQTPTELKSWLPQVQDWSISEKMEIFNPDNLFDRINGAAPLYIENNFREMTSLEYTKGDDYITIQAYRHANPEDAFGMYASERSPDLKFYPFAGEAQGDDASIFFFAGNMYIKMWSNSSENISNTLQTIAKAFAKKIDFEASYPRIIQTFPSKDKVPYTETYITSNYIGHEFLRSVYTAKYKTNNQAFQLFVIDAKTKDKAQDILNKYFTFTKQPLDFQEGGLIIKDKYNGDIPIIWKEQYIVGVFSDSGEAVFEGNTYLKSLIDNLFKSNNLALSNNE